MTEVLDKPPEEEGDDREAGGGGHAKGTVSEDDLKDTGELDDDDYEDADETPVAQPAGTEDDEA